MELRHIRYFLAVAEEMNFTRAAEKLCIAQPPLSRQIQELETELGTKLFVRKPHALQLTEEGILFRQYAQQIVDLVKRSAEDVSEMEKGLQGIIFNLQNNYGWRQKQEVELGEKTRSSMGAGELRIADKLALLAEERDALLMTEREDDGEEADAEGT